MIAEPFEPPKHALELIEDAIENIDTDTPASMSKWFREYSQTHKHRIAFDYDMVLKHCTQTSVIVEAASVPFMLTVALQNTGYNVIGVDICPERFQHTVDRVNLDIRKCDVEHEPLPFPDNFCDVIVFNEFFEHLRIDLIFTMKQVFRILKPGGRLLLSTPNVRSLHGIRNLLLKRRTGSYWMDLYEQYEKLEKYGHMGHVREYTSNEVVGFLRKIGFEDPMIIYRGTYASKLESLIIRLRPNLRPYFSCVMRKPL